MAEEQEKTTTDKPATDPPKGGGLTVSDLRNMVTELVKDAVGAAKAPEGAPASDKAGTETQATRSTSIASEVQRQVDKIRAKDEREAKDKKIQDALTELSEKTKEKPPVERRRVHKLMGWGEPPQ